jgi:hypothetical protein
MAGDHARSIPDLRGRPSPDILRFTPCRRREQAFEFDAARCTAHPGAHLEDRRKWETAADAVDRTPGENDWQGRRSQSDCGAEQHAQQADPARHHDSEAVCGDPCRDRDENERGQIQGHHQRSRAVIDGELVLDASEQGRKNLQQAAKAEVGAEEQDVGLLAHQRTAQACAEFARSCAHISATSALQRRVVAAATRFSDACHRSARNTRQPAVLC